MVDLEYGATYFQVTFADPGLTMPGIKPLVYIGANLIGDEEENTHYFQDPVSVQVHGLWQEAENKNECAVYTCADQHIGTDIVNIEQASRVMEESVSKAKELGFPKLRRLKGPWVQGKP